MENDNFRVALLAASSNCGIPTILVLFIRNRSVGDMLDDAGCKDEYDDSGDTARQTEEVQALTLVNVSVFVARKRQSGGWGGCCSSKKRASEPARFGGLNT